MPKMKAYATFDLYLADQSPKNKRIIRALRTFVKRTAPKLEESVKWGNGCWLEGGGPVAYVYSDVDYVQFGFIRGASLADPECLLEGQGQFVRHTKVRQVTDIDPRTFGALLRQAVEQGPVRPSAGSSVKRSKQSSVTASKKSASRSRSAKRS